MSLFARNLLKYGKPVTLQNRAIVPPLSGSVDFDESFTNDTIVQAILKTKRGETLFDGVATDQPITHRVCIAWLAGVTAETWIELADGTKLDIVDVENCGEQDVKLILSCTARGTGKAAET